MLRFGPGGTAGLGYDEGLKKIKELGLSALEIEFTHGVHMGNSEAKRVGDIAKKLGICLSIHAPYFINLSSKEKEKIAASKKRILDSCERAHHLGAEYVVFHAGFYQKSPKEEIFMIIREQIMDLLNIIKEKKWKVFLAPELTGKPSQFGDIDELLRLRKDTKCHFTIDFSHWKARMQGKIDFAQAFDKIKDFSHIHSHFSGIEWTEKGERRHLLTTKEDILPLAKEAVKRKMDMTFINESPEPIEDAYKMKKIFEELI